MRIVELMEMKKIVGTFEGKHDFLWYYLSILQSIVISANSQIYLVGAKVKLLQLTNGSFNPSFEVFKPHM